MQPLYGLRKMTVANCRFTASCLPFVKKMSKRVRKPPRHFDIDGYEPNETNGGSLRRLRSRSPSLERNSESESPPSIRTTNEGDDLIFYDDPSSAPVLGSIQRNVIFGRVKRRFSENDLLFSVFEAFFPRSLMSDLTKFTNEHAVAKSAGVPYLPPLIDGKLVTPRSWSEVTLGEMYVHYGIHVLMASFDYSEERMYWSVERTRRHEVISAQSHTRFQQIRRYKRLYSAHTPENVKLDPLWRVRGYLKGICERSRAIYDADLDIAVDEASAAWDGRWYYCFHDRRFKPDPNAIEFFTACCRGGYVINTLLNANDSTILPEEDVIGHPKSTVNTTLNLLAPLDDVGHNFFCDNRFTDADTFEYLYYRKNMRCCGTQRPHWLPNYPPKKQSAEWIRKQEELKKWRAKYGLPSEYPPCEYRRSKDESANLEDGTAIKYIIL